MDEPGKTVDARAALSLIELSLENIGPFDSAKLRFLDEEEGAAQVRVAIITGENGTGKSILIDAIRGMFGLQFANLERPIWRPDTPFRIDLTMLRDGQCSTISSTDSLSATHLLVANSYLMVLPAEVMHRNRPAPGWVVDFWRSNLATDTYAITGMSAQNPRAYLSGALQGVHQNADVTKLLVHFDYLRDSRDPREKRAGEVLFNAVRTIVEKSLLDGELLHIARSTLTPMFRQGGHTLPLSSLSSGSTYIMQRMIGLLAKMYDANTLREEEPEQVLLTPGLLLLDEAENHLHPRWQKRFLPDVLSLFPNLQIIATTHSPLVVGSVPGAKVFVCRYDEATRVSTVADVTADYADRPVDDILASDAFNGTEPFGREITDLLEKRQKAIQNSDAAARAELEAKLYERNPTYFSYLKLGEHLQALRAG